MTATYSEKRLAKAAPFHLQATASVTPFAAEYDAWNSAESEQDHSEYPEAQWPEFEPAGSRAALDSDWAETKDEVGAATPIEFTHASEQEFARVLDARDTPWQYKPRTFAVDWDDEGNFVDCFTPDFYLSANDTYIALIAPDCSESNAKVRNVKLLRRHHPEIRIEIVRCPYSRH